MAKGRKEWPLKIQFETALHHGSGFGMAGLVDRCALRGSDGLPYLAGSALKGKFRYSVLRLELWRGHPACEFGDRPVCKEQEPCVMCRLFGSRVKRGALLFTDAYLPEDHRALFVADELKGEETRALFRSDALYRATTAMDRVRAVAKVGHLFTTEVLPARLEFEGEIRGPEEFEALLKEAAGLLTHFGAGGARGLGRCNYRIGGQTE